MARQLILLCLSICVGSSTCTGQTDNFGDAMVYAHNFGENVGDEWPIFIFDGRMNQLAPPGTRVQVLARAVGSIAAFEFVHVPFQNSYSLTTFEVPPRDPGLFDGGPGIIPGLRGEMPAEFTVRAWLGSATWEGALTNAFAFVGQTPIFTNWTGELKPVPDLSIPATITNAHSFTMYPFPQACRLVPFVGLRPLCVGVSISGQTLVFTWADLGTNYVYTLEFKPSLTATNWTPVPGTIWPARTNQFILPNPPTAPSFYRIRAQGAQ